MPKEKVSWIDNREKLIKDFKNGLSYKDLAEKYKVSIASIRSKLYEYRKKGLVGKRQ